MNSSLLWRGSTGLAIALVLIVIDVWLWHSAQSARQAIATTRSTLAEQPSQALEIASLQSEITRRQGNLQRLKQYILPKSELEIFVSRLEQEAEQYRLELTIPAVQARVANDTVNSPVNPDQLTEQVEFRLAATGRPEDLLAFIHRVEFLPYLLYLESWSVKSEQRATPPTPPEASPTAAPVSGQLEAVLILTLARSPL